MRNWKLVAIIVVVILALITSFITTSMLARNHAYNLEEQINVAQSNIDVQQKRRADLIPNLVECVKAYDKHEYDTLIAIVNARKVDEQTVNDIQMAIAAIAEAYPELQSSTNYRELMNELSITENLIANYRSNYNSQVRRYKNYVRRFPYTFLLSLTGYKKLDYNYLMFENTENAPTLEF